MLVISNRPRASRSSDFEITRAITPWIVLHSVQLLLLITGNNVIFTQWKHSVKFVVLYIRPYIATYYIDTSVLLENTPLVYRYVEFIRNHIRNSSGVSSISSLVRQLVARTISNSFAALTREILFLPPQRRIHILTPPCNILYLQSICVRDRKTPVLN